MAGRAAICIGVNQAGTMTGLHAAARGARDFAEWAQEQGCDVDVLVDDDGAKIGVSDVFDAVSARVEARAYNQLIIYFSGHGVLTGPGTEFWLLSRAPQNPNEAVNLRRAIDDAYYCGIPHVIFISDACRSNATGPPLNGINGGSIFPNIGYVPNSSEVDVFYATRPGDPAWEVPLEEATRKYTGVFTDILLTTVKTPDTTLVEHAVAGDVTSLDVVSSWKLKERLEAIVPVRAADFDVRIRQSPELRVQTRLPKYFATVDPANVQQPRRLARDGVSRVSMESALQALTAPDVRTDASDLATRIGLNAEVDHLLEKIPDRIFGVRIPPMAWPETGFAVRGAKLVNTSAKGWEAHAEGGVLKSFVMAVRPIPPNSIRDASSIVLTFSGQDGKRTGAILPILNGFIGTAVIDEGGRVISIQYSPSEGSHRFDPYRNRAPEIDKMRAAAAVAARHGRFEVPEGDAGAFAERIRQDKNLDPVLGIYAAYAYAQVGRYDDVYSVFRYMNDGDLPVPFDVAMLASLRRRGAIPASHARYSPFVPLLSQGWALLAHGDAMHHPIIEQLRPHLVPSLWTTLTPEGIAIAEDFNR